MKGSYALDLVVLVADLDQQETIRSLIEKRSQSLGIRPIKSQLLKHPRHDPGCYYDAPALLQPFQERAAHGLVLLDRVGSGQEKQSAEQMETDLDRRLTASGWGTRARSVIIDPELEIWVWSDSTQVDKCLGWSGKNPPLRDWLRGQGLLPLGTIKPPMPKEALALALRETRQRASASIFAQIANAVSLDRCQDPSFARLRAHLRAWFPS